MCGFSFQQAELIRKNGMSSYLNPSSCQTDAAAYDFYDGFLGEMDTVCHGGRHS